MSSSSVAVSNDINPLNGLRQARPGPYTMNLKEYSYQVQQHLGAACTPEEYIRYNSASFGTYNTRLYGIELEVERRKNTPPDIIMQVYKSMPDFVMCKKDGSITNGFEIVSAPATLAAHRKMWPKFLQSRADKKAGVLRPGGYLAGFRTTTCGMHIHISRNSIPPSVLIKFWKMINDTSHDMYTSRIAGRRLSQELRLDRGHINYCQLRPESLAKILYNPEIPRNSAINLHNMHTIEVRIFRSNTDLVGMLKNLDFVDAMLAFCSAFLVDKLNGREFIAWVTLPKQRQSYPYLNRWLIRHKVHLLNLIKEAA